MAAVCRGMLFVRERLVNRRPKQCSQARNEFLDLQPCGDAKRCFQSPTASAEAGAGRQVAAASCPTPNTQAKPPPTQTTAAIASGAVKCPVRSSKYPVSAGDTQ